MPPTPGFPAALRGGALSTYANGRMALATSRAGVTMVELLTVTAVIVILLALMLPALTRMRETTRRTTCQSRLRSIGIALAQYESTFSALPAGRDAYAQRDHSWATRLLPYLGHADLFERYSFQHRWDEAVDSSNQTIANTMLPAFLCPATTHPDPGSSDYGGNYGSSLSGMRKGFGIGRAWDSGVLLAIHAPARKKPRTNLISHASITDGLGQTFAVLEDAGRRASENGQWANGQNCLAHEYASVNESHKQGIYSDHPGGAHALLADGGIRFVANSTDKRVLGAYSTRANQDSVAYVTPLD